MQPVIPDKTYLKIGEVARLAAIRTSVLRYWETEFDFLRPEKSSTGQRLYTHRDVEMVLLIKQLLYNDKYTIEGVRNRFRSRRKPEQKLDFVEQAPTDSLRQLLQHVKQELLAIRSLL